MEFIILVSENTENIRYLVCFYMEQYLYYTVFLCFHICLPSQFSLLFWNYVILSSIILKDSSYKIRLLACSFLPMANYQMVEHTEI